MTSTFGDLSSWQDTPARNTITTFLELVTTPGSPAFVVAERILEEAAKNRWTVVNMKDDWATVFSDPAQSTRRAA
jgi:hypothetical protein